MAKLHVKYISDLHLDYKTENDKKKFLKLFNQKDTYIIAGDFYNDYRKTLIMIEQLEKMKIHGY
jgi:predicted phosphodiesterase